MESENQTTNQLSLLQLLNRIVEWAVNEDVVDVCKDFMCLVEYGLDPEYAFEVVISERRSMHRELQHGETA